MADETPSDIPSVVSVGNVEVEFTQNGDHYVATAVTLRRGTRAGGVTAEAWRSVAVRKVIDTARAQLHQALAAELVTSISWEGEPPTVADLALVLADAEKRNGTRRGPGRPRDYGPEHYRRVAEVFLAAQGDPDSGSAYVAVAREVPGAGGPDDRGTEKRDRQRAERWVRNARAMGLLPPAQPRRKSLERKR